MSVRLFLPKTPYFYCGYWCPYASDKLRDSWSWQSNKCPNFGLQLQFRSFYPPVFSKCLLIWVTFWEFRTEHYLIQKSRVFCPKWRSDDDFLNNLKTYQIMLNNFVNFWHLTEFAEASYNYCMSLYWRCVPFSCSQLRTFTIAVRVASLTI